MHVVVGSGISGLVTAALLSRRLPHGSVVVVDSAAAPGGLLRSFDYGPMGRFDQGTHIMADTGDEELDGILRSLLPEGDWQLLEGELRDLAGAFFNGRLQANSPYLDLRFLGAPHRDRCLASVLDVLGDSSDSPAAAGDLARARFGADVADQHVLPALEAAFGPAVEDLDRLSMQVAPMDRVVLVEGDVYLALSAADAFRARIAFPEQRRLPVTLGDRRRSYYPRAGGIGLVVDALIEELRVADVRLLLDTNVESVLTAAGSVSELVVTHAGCSSETLPTDHLFWSAGLPGIAKLLDVAMPGAPDQGATTVIVNLRVDERPRTGGVYYFYCYAPGTWTFRVTSYAEFCDGVAEGPSFPLSVELLVPPGERLDPDALVDRALREAAMFGIVDAERPVPFARAEPLGRGFPRSTTRNVSMMSDLRGALEELGHPNLHLIGGFAEDRQFFQRDVLAHAHQVVNEVLPQPASG